MIGNWIVWRSGKQNMFGEFNEAGKTNILAREIFGKILLKRSAGKNRLKLENSFTLSKLLFVVLTILFRNILLESTTKYTIRKLSTNNSYQHFVEMCNIVGSKTIVRKREF